VSMARPSATHAHITARVAAVRQAAPDAAGVCYFAVITLIANTAMPRNTAPATSDSAA
jgi:hypothetical protein